eukprot:TRINITY_DN4640_c0_g1_i1.p1 TRINITY_DN4640_c0_g1~~TRINITY_DN4640_c0_g1_i1.p1  ORF type:complete len:453 (+),score=88.49 TRINITY_DN4640_c0_g1_i1:108-1466(+)
MVVLLSDLPIDVIGDIHTSLPDLKSVLSAAGTCRLWRASIKRRRKELIMRFLPPPEMQTSTHRHFPTIVSEGLEPVPWQQALQLLTDDDCKFKEEREAFLTCFPPIKDPNLLFHEILQLLWGDEPPYPILIKKGMIDLLTSWLRLHPYHFDSNKLDALSLLLMDVERPDSFEAINARKIAIELERVEEREPSSDHPRTDAEMEILLRSPKTFAMELTRRDEKFFRQIERRELLSQNWIRANKEEVAPNLTKFVRNFNAMCNWIARMILKPETQEDRTRMVSQILALHKALHDLKNYNTSMAMCAGLGQAPIYRLKIEKHFDPDEKKFFDSVGQFFMSGQRYRVYREQLEGDTHHLPFMGVTLTDLTFLHDSVPDRSSTVIDIPQMVPTYRIMQGTLNQRISPEHFTVNHMEEASNLEKADFDALIDAMYDPANEVDQNDLYDISLQRKPRRS